VDEGLRGTSRGVGKKDGWKVRNDQEFIVKGLAEKGRRTKNQSIHPHPPIHPPREENEGRRSWKGNKD